MCKLYRIIIYLFHVYAMLHNNLFIECMCYIPWHSTYIMHMLCQLVSLNLQIDNNLALHWTAQIYPTVVISLRMAIKLIFYCNHDNNTVTERIISEPLISNSTINILYLESRDTHGLNITTQFLNLNTMF